jgi:uncharacterized membrane protein YedE/YeeE
MKLSFDDILFEINQLKESDTIKPESKSMNPYIGGALTGVVLVLSIVIADQYFGTSTSFIRTAGLLESIFAREHMEQVSYFREVVPKIDWQWMFVVGVFLGGLISAVTSGSFRFKALPEMWEARFGPDKTRRFVVAFIGGIVIIIGARMAGG